MFELNKQLDVLKKAAEPLAPALDAATKSVDEFQKTLDAIKAGKATQDDASRAKNNRGLAGENLTKAQSGLQAAVREHNENPNADTTRNLEKAKLNFFQASHDYRASASTGVDKAADAKQFPQEVVNAQESALTANTDKIKNIQKALSEKLPDGTGPYYYGAIDGRAASVKAAMAAYNQSHGGKGYDLDSYAEGHIPDLVKHYYALSEQSAAAKAGYSIVPSQVKTMTAKINGAIQPVVYNSRERVIHNFAGTGEPAIIPPGHALENYIHAAAGIEPFSVSNYLGADGLKKALSDLAVGDITPAQLQDIQTARAGADFGSRVPRVNVPTTYVNPRGPKVSVNAPEHVSLGLQTGRATPTDLFTSEVLHNGVVPARVDSLATAMLQSKRANAGPPPKAVAVPKPYDPRTPEQVAAGAEYYNNGKISYIRIPAVAKPRTRVEDFLPKYGPQDKTASEKLAAHLDAVEANLHQLNVPLGIGVSKTTANYADPRGGYDAARANADFVKGTINAAQLNDVTLAQGYSFDRSQHAGAFAGGRLSASDAADEYQRDQLRRARAARPDVYGDKYPVVGGRKFTPIVPRSAASPSPVPVLAKASRVAGNAADYRNISEPGTIGAPSGSRFEDASTIRSYHKSDQTYVDANGDPVLFPDDVSKTARDESGRPSIITKHQDLDPLELSRRGIGPTAEGHVLRQTARVIEASRDNSRSPEDVRDFASSVLNGRSIRQSTSTDPNFSKSLNEAVENLKILATDKTQPKDASDYDTRPSRDQASNTTTNHYHMDGHSVTINGDSSGIDHNEMNRVAYAAVLDYARNGTRIIPPVVNTPAVQAPDVSDSAQGVAT